MGAAKAENAQGCQARTEGGSAQGQAQNPGILLSVVAGDYIPEAKNPGDWCTGKDIGESLGKPTETGLHFGSDSAQRIGQGEAGQEEYQGQERGNQAQLPAESKDDGQGDHPSQQVRNQELQVNSVIRWLRIVAVLPSAKRPEQ